MKIHLLLLELCVAVTLAANIGITISDTGTTTSELSQDIRNSSSSKRSKSSRKDKTKGDSSIKKSKRSKDVSADGGKSCSPEEFACDGLCLNPKLLCDNIPHCKDGSDELHCKLLEECSGADDFLCANQKCISMKWVCDGVNDCSLHGDGDLTDEIHCDNVTSSATKKDSVIMDCERESSFKCDNGHCIPHYYWCDGEIDCADGSDEKSNCEVKSDDCVGKFKCESGECLNLKYKCNDKIDCLDGWSDEEFCTKPHECLLSDGKFLCKTGGMCIDATKVCNKANDCLDNSDEFPNCEQSCKNSTCSQGCVPDSSQNATGSGACYCSKGFQQSSRDKEKCLDIDECEIFGKCSQVCNNLVGSYECSCRSGFTLDKDGSSCTLKDNSTSLIFALHSGIRVLQFGKKEKYYSLVEKLGSPVMVSYDARNEWVYWTDALEHEEAIWRSKLNGDQLELVVSTGLILPEGIAFDWIANNIYFADSNRSHIVVCTEDGGNCTVLIQEQMDKPRDLALDPNVGLLFWTDWGINPSIIKAGMDGSSPISIISDNVKWPNGITVDQGNSRIYWTDASTDRIETANYFGENRKIVKSKGINHPFGVDILGDNIYWSDWNLYEIQSSNKFNGSKSHFVLVKENFEQLNGLVLYHKANQPIFRRNHCADAGCSHICTLTPNKSYKCMCPRGFSLNQRDKKSCMKVEAWPHFIVGYNNTLKTVPMDTIGGNVLKTYVIPEISVIGSISPVPFNNTVFLSDLERKKIYSFNLLTEQLIPIVEDNIIFVKGMDFDEISGNLYWVDSSKKTLEVLNLKTKTRVILFKEIDRPIDIVLAPDIRMMFLAELGPKGGKIVRMNMNGYNRRVLHRRTGGDPFAITYNKEMNRVYWYWTDGTSETIESVAVDGTSDYVAVARPGAPFGIASLHKKIYWTDRHTLTLKGRCLISLIEERGMYLGNYSVSKDGHFLSSRWLAKLEILNKEPNYDASLVKKHACSNNNNLCSHMCLMSDEEFEGTCVCPENLRLDTDGRTCIDLSPGDVSTSAICTKGRCRKQPSTKKNKSKSKPNKTGTDVSKSEEEDVLPDGRSSSDDQFDDVITEDSSTTEFYIDEGFAWFDDDVSDKKKSKGKKSKNKKPYERERRKQMELDYDEYEEGISPLAKVLPNGNWYIPGGEPITQQESSLDKNVVSEGTHPMAIVVGVLILLVLVGVIIGIVLHRRNVHPKVLVRPYVQHWVRYVNQPVQRFFEGRGGEQLDGKGNIYDEVYHSSQSSEHTYSNAGYEEIDSVADDQILINKF